MGSSSFAKLNLFSRNYATRGLRLRGAADPALARVDVRQRQRRLDAERSSVRPYDIIASITRYIVRLRYGYQNLFYE
jgi:hypothetical protein